MRAGDRVCLSALGARMMARRARRQGAIVALGRDPECVRVLWDGLKHPQTWYRPYLHVLPTRPNPPATDTP